MSHLLATSVKNTIWRLSCNRKKSERLPEIVLNVVIFHIRTINWSCQMANKDHLLFDIIYRLWVGGDGGSWLSGSVSGLKYVFCVLSLWSLRAKFALDDTKINMLHGSDSEDQAKRELEFFFPMQQTVAVIKPDAVGTKGTKWKEFLVNKCISTCSCCKKSASQQYTYQYYKLSKKTNMENQNQRGVWIFNLL